MLKGNNNLYLQAKDFCLWEVKLILEMGLTPKSLILKKSSLQNYHLETYHQKEEILWVDSLALLQYFVEDVILTLLVEIHHASLLKTPSGPKHMK